jgi:hypothetical protein
MPANLRVHPPRRSLAADPISQPGKQTVASGLLDLDNSIKPADFRALERQTRLLSGLSQQEAFRVIETLERNAKYLLANP